MASVITSDTELIPVRAEDLVALDDYTQTHPLRIDHVYADAAHPRNIFGVAIYRPSARMWCHRDLAPIVLKAAEICFAQSGLLFEIKDCLRPVEAQAMMAETDIVRAHPHWLQEPNRLLSPPGRGGHPRGMAVDIVLVDENGVHADMGTPFDHLTDDRDNNPAARSYKNFPVQILQNRQLLEDSMCAAAKSLGLEILPLPQEWWDFRFPPAYSSRYAPVHDADLPPAMRMMQNG